MIEVIRGAVEAKLLASNDSRTFATGATATLQTVLPFASLPPPAHEQLLQSQLQGGSQGDGFSGSQDAAAGGGGYAADGEEEDGERDEDEAAEEAGQAQPKARRAAVAAAAPSAVGVKRPGGAGGGNGAGQAPVPYRPEKLVRVDYRCVDSSNNRCLPGAKGYLNGQALFMPLAARLLPCRLANAAARCSVAAICRPVGPARWTRLWCEAPRHVMQVQQEPPRQATCPPPRGQLGTATRGARAAATQQRRQPLRRARRLRAAMCLASAADGQGRVVWTCCRGRCCTIAAGAEAGRVRLRGWSRRTCWGLAPTLPAHRCGTTSKWT